MPKKNLGRTDKQRMDFLENIPTGSLTKEFSSERGAHWPWDFYISNSGSSGKMDSLREAIDWMMEECPCRIPAPSPTKPGIPNDKQRMDFLENAPTTSIVKEYSTKRGAHWPWVITITNSGSSPEFDELRDAIDYMMRKCPHYIPDPAIRHRIPERR